MGVSVRHKFQSVKADGADSSLVRPSNWNDWHDVDLTGALKALSALDASAGQVPYFTAAETAALTALSDLGKTILATATVLELRALIGAASLAQGAKADNAQPVAQKGLANGYAGLDSSAKIPTAQLPDAVLGALSYKGSWNANTNSPAMPAAAAGNKGWYYLVTVAGSTNVSGITDWKVGDWIVSNGGSWDKCDNTDAVIAVAGLTGSISAGSLKTALALAIADIAGLQAALDGKAPSSHGHVIADVTNLQSSLDAKAPLVSPAFTSNPTAPTQATADSSTRLATTAFVKAVDATRFGVDKLLDAVLPNRLRIVGTTITDWNAATENGWYMGNSAANAPAAAWCLGWVEAHNAIYVTQTIHQFTLDSASDTKMWRRNCDNGTWGSWYRIRISEAELDARYQLLSLKGVANGYAGLDAAGCVPVANLPAGIGFEASGFVLQNGKAVASVASNNLTIAIKTRAGADPSAGDPVKIEFADGTVRVLAAALSLVVPAGATLGLANGVPFNLWLVAFDDSGTVRLGVRNNVVGKDVRPLAEWLPASATSISAAADDAGVFYAGATVSSKPFRPLGFFAFTAGLATAGNWSVTPSTFARMGPGVARPGDVVQSVATFTAGPGSTNSGSVTDVPAAAVSITPVSSCSLVDVDFAWSCDITNVPSVNAYGRFWVWRDSTNLTPGLSVFDVGTPTAAGGAGAAGGSAFVYRDAPASAGAVTYKLRYAASAGTVTAQSVSMRLREIMT